MDISKFNLGVKGVQVSAVLLLAWDGWFYLLVFWLWK